MEKTDKMKVTMFQSDHSGKNLFLGTFLGMAVGALTTLYLGTNGGKDFKKTCYIRCLKKLENLELRR